MIELHKERDGKVYFNFKINVSSDEDQEFVRKIIQTIPNVNRIEYVFDI